MAQAPETGGREQAYLAPERLETGATHRHDYFTTHRHTPLCPGATALRQLRLEKGGVLTLCQRGSCTRGFNLRPESRACRQRSRWPARRFR